MCLFDTPSHLQWENMLCVNSALNEIAEIVGKQSVATKGFNLRRSVFCVEKRLSDGCLLYNSFTRELLWIENEEENKSLETYLYENWFLVNANFDEIAFYDSFFSLYKMSFPNSNGLYGYTILTTTNCNAKCFYCYEKGMDLCSMTETTANKVANFIVRTNDANKIVNLNWFGGEPLLNCNVIDIVSKILTENGVTFISNITTNGFLFDKSLVKKALSLWKLKDVQITLDGTSDLYNKVKSYETTIENPYDLVVSNIYMLLDEGVNVSIRLNLGLYNMNNLSVLVDELYKKWNMYNNLRVYCGILYSEFGNSKQKYTSEQLKALIDCRITIEDKIRNLGMSQGNLHLNRGITSSRCMADNDSCVVIFPNGKLGKCDSRLDDGFVGCVDDESFNENSWWQYRVRSEKLPECRECFRYPDCIRLEMCQEHKECYGEVRDRLLEDTKQAMLNDYHAFLEREKENANNEDKVS